MLCCFLNVLTTLPAKCCETGLGMHNSKTTATRSFTVIQYLFDILGDESETGNTGPDVHCSVFNVAHRQTFIQSVQFFCKAGDTGATKTIVAAINYTGYNARQFPLPQHHSYLFRLTPF